MNDLIIRQFKNHQVRYRLDEDREIWWITKDICNVLGIKKTEVAYKRIKEKDRKLTPTIEGGQVREMLEVNNSGMFSLVLSSKKGPALEFKDWVTSEVLPSIAKTGTYSVVKREMTPIEILRAQLEYMNQAEQRICRNEKETEALREQVEVVNEIVIEATSKIQESQKVIAEVVSREDEDTLLHTQISEIDLMIKRRADELIEKGIHRLVAYKATSNIKKQIKQDSFALCASRTYKEIPRKKFNRALQIINEYQLSAKLLEENKKLLNMN